MSVRRFSFLLVHSLITVAILILSPMRLIEMAVRPIMAFIRDAPVAATLSILPRFKAVYFAVIGSLKPVYRESFRTNGQSLDTLRTA